MHFNFRPTFDIPVIPGKPRIDLIREDSFNASISFSRAVEMTCFGRQTIPLVTQITLFRDYGIGDDGGGSGNQNTHNGSIGRVSIITRF